ncbi:MAG: hypothetical protein EPO28_17580 [Saprospiraceae bacterium]|nr:MAG: hypothetical protein EPO28_17580 [Saprospiraceae bacterium]
MKNFTKSFLSFVIVAMMGTFAFAGSAASSAPALTTDTGPTVTGWFLKDGQSMAAEDFLSLTPKKIKESTGEKLSLKERLALRYVQSQIKRDIKKGISPADATFNLDDEARRFNIGGFLLGLFLGLIGFLISLLFRNRNVRRSALLGWGIAVVIYLIVLAVG